MSRVLATDTFTRSDAATLGSNWATAKGFGESLGVMSNQVKSVTGSGRPGNYYSAITAPADQYSQIVIVAHFDQQGPMVRAITSGSQRNHYFAGADNNNFGGGNTVSRITKEVANVVTSLGTGATTLANGQTLYLEVQGTSLKMKINGTDEISVSDSSFSTGQFGIRTTDGLAADTVILDTWEGGDFAAATLTGTAMDSITEADIV